MSMSIYVNAIASWALSCSDHSSKCHLHRHFLTILVTRRWLQAHKFQAVQCVDSVCLAWNRRHWTYKMVSTLKMTIELQNKIYRILSALLMWRPPSKQHTHAYHKDAANTFTDLYGKSWPSFSSTHRTRQPLIVPMFSCFWFEVNLKCVDFFK